MAYAYTQHSPIRFVDPDGTDTRPVPGVVTSQFGTRTLEGQQEVHNAVDMANNLGAPVVAFRSGVVVNVTQGQGVGGNRANAVTIRYDDPISGESRIGVYAHVTSTLTQGARVAEGAIIGTTDVSGRSTGPHLHYYQKEWFDEGLRNPTQLLENSQPFSLPDSNNQPQTDENSPDGESWM